MKRFALTFIAPEPGPVAKKDPARPASYIRKEFQAKKTVKKATLYMTALGMYQGYLNGEPLDDRRMLPGFTNYNARLQVQEFDVTDRVKIGENTLAVILGEGWFRGSLGVRSNRNCYGDELAIAAKLVLEYKGGGSDVVETDTTWKATQDGPITTNDLKVLETYDARLEMPGWLESGFDESEWHKCRKAKYKGELIPHEGTPVREKERFSGTALVTPGGENVVDFGQNLAGHVEFTVTGHAGDTVTLEMGETLDENGNFTVKNLTTDESTSVLDNELGQKLVYILKEGTQTYKSQFLVSGYRYIRVTGWPEEVRGENFTSIAIYSDMKQTGSFECSNEKINQFVHNSLWSWRSNSVDIPTDCPTRERAGWTGDINVYGETASYLCDTHSFLRKYLADVKSHQLKNGSLPCIAPEVKVLPGKLNHFADNSAGWSDVLVNLPWTLYRFYGTTDEIELFYEAAKKFVDHGLARLKRPGPDLMLIRGFHWGEWLEPGRPMPADILSAVVKGPDMEVVLAWLYQSTKQLSEMAELLDRGKDAAHYAKQAEKVRKEYRSRFLKHGVVKSDRQCRYVRPVFMGLAEPEEAKRIVADLAEMVRKNDYKIGTGFLTTYQVLQTLTDYGFQDVAYKMMENEACPSWLYEVCKGATTTWENWEGINEEGIPNNSLNHYAPGAAAAWLYSHVGGIRPAAPGFEKILIQPVPGGTLTYANTTYESVKGTIRTRWTRDGETFRLQVDVPKGVPAEVVLPDGQTFVQKKPSASYQCPVCAES